MSQPSTSPVSCNGGNDGTAEVTYSGGVGPYTVDWGGYNPNALPAGEYTVEVLDANLCSQEESFLITEPAPFNLELSAVMPECNDPESGVITPDVNGGTGDVTLNWDGINQRRSAGIHCVATDEGLAATATVVVPPAEIPESLELDGNTEVTQGDAQLITTNLPWQYVRVVLRGALKSRSCLVRHFRSVGHHRVCLRAKPTKRAASATCLSGCVCSRRRLECERPRPHGWPLPLPQPRDRFSASRGFSTAPWSPVPNLGCRWKNRVERSV